MTRIRLIAFAVLGVALSGCAITSSARQNTGAGEGIWYVKTPMISVMKVKIFYCPPQAADCYQADVIDPSKGK